ncbi:hypothetical protein [uncultured Veillonella sp.]|uniref:hypothetical protein n=1 Tax=uncultured Veillonella sp. TaxID=159268 RepID=UPI002629AC32|nr:hypothetical protein [uncultured Veillonella sp.]
MRKHWYSLLGATLWAASVGTTPVQGADQDINISNYNDLGIVIESDKQVTVIVNHEPAPRVRPAANVTRDFIRNNFLEAEVLYDQGFSKYVYYQLKDTKSDGIHLRVYQFSDKAKDTRISRSDVVLRNGICYTSPALITIYDEKDGREMEYVFEGQSKAYRAEAGLLKELTALGLIDKMNIEEK